MIPFVQAHSHQKRGPISPLVWGIEISRSQSYYMTTTEAVDLTKMIFVFLEYSCNVTFIIPIKWHWFRPGSNWRPSACKADVITTTPRNPDNEWYLGYLYHCIVCFKNVTPNKICLSRVAREGGMVDYFPREASTSKTYDTCTSTLSPNERTNISISMRHT